MAVPASSDPSAILREAKGIGLDLKKALKTSAPWDRPVELLRQRLRDHYVRLIFQDTRADMAQQLLWSDTSHAVINAYRTRIQGIERSISADRSEMRSSSRRSSHGPVELRKVAHDFRGFLVEEEKFWLNFSLRFIRTYGLEHTMSVLSRAGISEAAPADGDSYVPAVPASSAAYSNEERRQKIDMLQRSVIYLGDLARYRQLNELVTIPKKAKNRSGTVTPNPSSPRAFAASENCYRAAFLLAPENGTPFNQLAILAMHQADTYTALYYYYRAACAKHPFGTVEENLENLFAKAIQTFKRTSAEDKLASPGTSNHSTTLESFKQDVVTLHALWARNSRATSQKLRENIEAVVPHMLSERLLTHEVNSMLLLMTFGALWRAERHSDHMGASQSESRRQPESVETATLIYKHATVLVNAFFKVGERELAQVLAGGLDAPPPLRISAVLRRILPSLRLSSRWMRMRFGDATYPLLSGVDAISESSILWRTYTAFVTALSSTFPQDVLPTSPHTLEEDVMSAGFLPLSDGKEALDDLHSGLGDDDHPNLEHMMRIADMLLDASAILARTQGMPTGPSTAAILTGAERTARTGLDDAADSSLADSDKADNVSTTTSEDPVNMAMRVALQSEALTDDEDDDADIVLFPHTAGGRERPTAEDLLLQALGPGEPSTPKGIPKAVPNSGAWSAKDPPRTSQPPVLFGANIWSGPLPGPTGPIVGQSTSLPSHAPSPRPPMAIDFSRYRAS